MSEFVVKNTYTPDQSTALRWLVSHLQRHKLLLVSVLIGSFGNAALAAFIPIYIGVAFNAALQSPADLRTIGVAAVAIVISQTVRAVLQFARNFSSAVIGERLERDMRRELYVDLLGKSMTFHDLQPVGDTMARATNDVREINYLVYPGINLVVGSANFLIMPLLFAPRYDWQLILAPLFFLVTYVWALVRYMNGLRAIADRVREAFGSLNTRLAEAIDGIEMVKGSAQEAQETERFRTNATEYRNAAVAQGYEEARFLPLLLLGITETIGFAHALILFQAGRLSIGDIVAYVGLLQLFTFPTFISLLAYSRLSLGLAGARRILALIHTQTELDQNAEGYQGVIEGTIEFRDVTFGYVERMNVLQGISFTVQQGQTVAVVGQTGSGKSTLAKLVNRTYDVTGGHLLIDGIDVRDWDLAALRRQISIIEQDIFLFSRTIAENIAFGNPKATPAMIEEAARAAQAHDFIMSFEHGYDTIVGQRGVTLSGGQRQRLALARAFLTDPRILILDDSTSAVDSATEDQIQRAIEQVAAARTTILITHRLSQIRWADLIVVLRKGQLAAVGDHTTLMATSPAYRRIFEQYEALDEEEERPVPT